MWAKLIAIVLVVAIPAGTSAGPLKEAVEEAGRKIALAQGEVQTGSRQRFWTGIALIAAGGVMTTLGVVEFGDDQSGPDDGEDRDDSDDGEDSDGWGNNALIGGGIASAALGSVMLIRGRRSGPVMTIHPKGMAVRHTIRF
jgi:hypothetical protein